MKRYVLFVWSAIGILLPLFFFLLGCWKGVHNEQWSEATFWVSLAIMAEMNSQGFLKRSKR